MKIALLSDIHGNSIALDAVLQDIAKQSGVDQYLILGDLAAIGFDPVGVLERIRALPNLLIVRGNTDRYLVTGELPAPTLTDIQSNPALVTKFAEVNKSFAWTQGAISSGIWFDWLATLPLEQRLTLPNGSRLLAVHASPGTDDGRGIRPDTREQELQSIVNNCDADIVCIGHNHAAFEHRVGGVHVVNPGSVSNPFPPDLSAGYAILNATESGYQVEYRRADYDNEAVVRQVQRLRHPAAPYITRFMRGENIAPWSKK
ncbi:MAG: metallophosphoesterase family protein [Chloroflexi bacterium]|nr:metallophosphoesterase family protein [Chloroflexota bacterium]